MCGHFLKELSICAFCAIKLIIRSFIGAAEVIYERIRPHNY